VGADVGVCQAGLAALLLPFVFVAVRGVNLLPSHEEYQKLLVERDAALARKDLEARAREAFQRQLENRNAKLGALCDQQRAQIEALRDQITETDYETMRRRLHAIRNA
jgi:HPt (histidine-containing phosphotransfer) domain-containing protein